MDNHTLSVQTITMLAGAGLLTGIGNLLSSSEKLTGRIVTGRALSSASLGAASTTVLSWMPDISTSALIGLACCFASLGTSGLERLLQRILGGK